LTKAASARQEMEERANNRGVSFVSHTKEQLEQFARSVPFWWHSIDLGHGVVTNGYRTADQLKHELEKLRLPDLRDKTVLDIGAYDGFFSFEAERRGAKRVVALDEYVWSLDLSQSISYWRECRTRGEAPNSQAQEFRLDHVRLPGMLAYNTSHKALESKVETIIADFMEADLSHLGTFDVVFYLGVLYHMQNPLESLKRVAALTGELAIIETESIALPAHENQALCEFFEGCELNDDYSNWWAPNEKAIVGMCLAAGFSRAEIIIGSPLPHPARKSPIAKLRSSVGFALREFGLREKLPEVVRFRAVVHAWK
jgi:tRNA (mo5U34)-methyltransferase